LRIFTDFQEFLLILVGGFLAARLSREALDWALNRLWETENEEER